MALLFDSVLVELLIVFIVLFATVYFYFKQAYTYWDHKGIPTTPATFPFGHIGPVLLGKVPIGHVLQNVYNKFRKSNKYAGFYIFSKPNFIVIDPELLKYIFVKDFKYFQNRVFYYNEKDDPLSAHLFAIEGQRWRDLRVKLSPTFTSGKLKFMFPTIIDQANRLNLYLKDAVNKGSDIEIKDVFARYNTDVIGTCAFGIECNSLKDPDAEFRKYGQMIFARSYLHHLKLLLATSYRNIARFLRVASVKPEVSEFLIEILKDTIKYREDNNIRKKDFMDLMIQLKNNGVLENEETNLKQPLSKLTKNEIAAQTFIFFAAGFETSSSVMSFCLYELALNQKIQENARAEIKQVVARHGGKITYETFKDLPYLDQIINETMRKYPTLPQLSRMCTMDYTIPGTDTVIRKGTPVFISVRGLHHDPQYYPDPDVFDPDRFTEENKAKRHPYSFLPFGEGPRICIGLRFAMLQTRLGIMTTLMNYNIQASEKTPIALKFDTNNFFTLPVGGMWLNLTPLM